MNTDASGRGSAGELVQTDRDGGTQTVSTASRGLTQTECRDSAASRELLTIVLALDNFKPLFSAMQSNCALTLQPSLSLAIVQLLLTASLGVLCR